MITTITGKNNFLAHHKLRLLKHDFIEEHGESGLIDLDGEELTIESVNQSVMSQGLFSSSTLVVIRDISKNKTLHEDLVNILDTVPGETHLVIFDTDLDRRTTFFKSLKKDTDFVDCAELDERELVQWARDEFSLLGKTLGFAEAQALVQRVNNDQWLLYNEIQKLSNVDGDITKSTIEEMVDESFNESIFSLLDSAFAKRPDRALKIYRNMLANKVEAHYIFSMLVWQLHTLLLVAYAGSTPPDKIAKDNKISPFVVQKSVGVFRKTSRKELKEIVNVAAKIDGDSKSKAGYNMDAAVDMLIAQIAT